MTTLESNIGKTFTHPKYGNVVVKAIASAFSDYGKCPYDCLLITLGNYNSQKWWIKAEKFLNEATCIS